MKLGLEVLGLLLAGLIASLATRLTKRRLSSTAAAFLVVAVVGAAAACAGIIVSVQRGVRAYQDASALNAESRLVPAATQVTARLRDLGLASAVEPNGEAPTWIRFVEWLRTRIPPDATFEISSPSITTRSQFRAWLDWRLFPRVQVPRSGRAQWIVFFYRDAPAQLAKTDVRFARGFSLARAPSDA